MRSVCGHENPEGNKYCGQCGAVIEPDRRSASRRAQGDRRRAADRRAGGRVVSFPRETSRSASMEDQRPLAQQIADRSRTADDRSQSSDAAPVIAQAEAPRVRDNDRYTSIGGPSFLGIGSSDTDTRSSSDYLFEDEPKRGFAWRRFALLAFVLVVLALFALQWRAMYHAKSVDLPPADAPATSPEQAPPAAEPEQNPPADPKNEKPAPQDAPRSDATQPEAGQPEAAQPHSAPPTPEPVADNEVARVDREPELSREEDPAPEPELEEEEPARLTAADHTLYERALRYLQGRGVPRDCDQGMMLLRAAANRPNPKARVQMAAQYSAGLCVPQDRAMAYVWFSRALELDPRNVWIERNRSSLYAQMSPDERARIAD